VIDIAMGALVVLAFLWARAAFVSLNRDMRVILDREAEIRERLDALEAQRKP
jgi:hypothetical protein